MWGQRRRVTTPGTRPGVRRGLAVLVTAGALTLASLGATMPAAPVTAPALGADVAAGARPVAAGSAGSRKPNIVVVMADDMRYDDLRFAPNVRRLFRAGGVEFRNSFSNNPICCPARASFLTGRLSHNHRVYSHLHPWGFKSFRDSRTIATTLRRNGYRTGFVGKYLNGYGRQRSRVTGRSSYTYVPAGWTRWYGAVERPARPGLPRGGTYSYYRTVYNIDGRPSGKRFFGEYQSATMGRFSRGLVDRFSKGSAPFFLYLSFVAPHHGGPRERDDPQPYWSGGRRFRLATPAVPAWVRGRYNGTVPRAPGLPASGRDPDGDVSDMPGFLRLPRISRKDRAAMREVTRQRAESIYVLDRQVGQLVAKLRRTGELSNTVLMFTSDNGYFLGEHRVRTGKLRAHEPSLRVPFLIRGPGIPRGQRRHAPVSTVDQAATILKVGRAASRHPLVLDGRSVLPDLQQDRGWTAPVPYEARLAGPRQNRVEAVLDQARMGRLQSARAAGFDDARDAVGVRTARWAYIRYRNGSGELYDLREDPNQLVNRFRDPDLADTRRQLQAALGEVRDCGGLGCLARLPEDLVTDPDTTRRLAERWHRSVRR